MECLRVYRYFIRRPDRCRARSIGPGLDAGDIEFPTQFAADVRSADNHIHARSHFRKALQKRGYRVI
jgi:hypothetical protein